VLQLHLGNIIKQRPKNRVATTKGPIENKKDFYSVERKEMNWTEGRNLLFKQYTTSQRPPSFPSCSSRLLSQISKLVFCLTWIAADWTFFRNGISTTTQHSVRMLYISRDIYALHTVLFAVVLEGQLLSHQS